jgi:hypothetical protein
MRSFWIDFIHYCRKVLLWVLPPLRINCIQLGIPLLLWDLPALRQYGSKNSINNDRRLDSTN